MLSKAEYNLRKSALKRQYQQAIQAADTTELMSNPFVAQRIQQMEARKALKGRGAYSWKDVGG